MPPRVVTTRGDFAFFVMHASRFDGYHASRFDGYVERQPVTVATVPAAVLCVVSGLCGVWLLWPQF